MRVRLLAAHYVRPDARVGSEHDVDEATAARLLERGVAEAVDATPSTPAPEVPDIDEMAHWTNAQLREFADTHDIGLGQATNKQQLLDAIRPHVE